MEPWLVEKSTLKWLNTMVPYIYIYKTFSKWQSRRYGDQINDCQGIGTH